jgi:ribosome-binding protein aMBF1 (putative translation factor)
MEQDPKETGRQPEGDDPKASTKQPRKRAADRAAPRPAPKKAKPKAKPKAGKGGVRAARIEKMMSKAELARRANLSVLTIDRVERGLGCRMDTKRKILEALGLGLADRARVFGEEE